MLAAERPLFPIGHDAEPIGSHTQLDEIISHRLGAFFSEHEVISRGAPFVTMPFDFELGAWIGPDPIDIPRQGLPSLLRNRKAVIGKKHVPEASRGRRRLLGANFFQLSSRRPWIGLR